MTLVFPTFLTEKTVICHFILNRVYYEFLYWCPHVELIWQKYGRQVIILISDLPYMSDPSGKIFKKTRFLSNCAPFEKFLVSPGKLQGFFSQTLSKAELTNDHHLTSNQLSACIIMWCNQAKWVWTYKNIRNKFSFSLYAQTSKLYHTQNPIKIKHTVPEI